MINFNPDEFIRKYGDVPTEDEEGASSSATQIPDVGPKEEESIEAEETIAVAEPLGGFNPDEFLKKYGEEPKKQTVESEDYLARQAEYLMSRPPLDVEIPEPEVEGDGIFRQALDIPINIKVGAVRGVKFMTDIFGADNPVSNALKSYEGIFTDLLSAESRQDQETIARIMQEAEDEGILGQIAAGLQAFTVAPLDMTAQAAGTMIPILAAGLVGKVAKLGATGVRALQAGAGGGMGVGVVKSEIYDGVYEYMLSKGVDEEEARRTASQAQAYNGKNLDSILIGGGLGIVAASTGAERIVSAIMMKAGGRPTGNLVQRIFKAGFTEAAPESAQGFQEKLSQNLALQREGADVDLGRGVFANAALEGTAGFTVGGPLGVFKAPLTPQEVAGLAKETQQAANQAKDVAPATADTVEKLADTISVDATSGPLARTEGETDEAYRARIEASIETPDQRVARLQREAQEGVDIELEEEVPVSGLPPVEPTPPVTPTVEGAVAPVEPVVPTETITQAFTQMGEGAVDSYYQAVLQSLQESGEVPTPERRSNVGQAWDRVRGTMTPEEFVVQLRQNAEDPSRIQAPEAAPAAVTPTPVTPTPVTPEVPKAVEPPAIAASGLTVTQETGTWNPITKQVQPLAPKNGGRNFRKIQDQNGNVFIDDGKSITVYTPQGASIELGRDTNNQPYVSVEGSRQQLGEFGGFEQGGQFFLNVRQAATKLKEKLGASAPQLVDNIAGVQPVETPSPAAAAVVETPAPTPALAPLRRVVKAEQTEDDVSGLVGQGLVELYKGQPVLTQAGLETLPEAERPRLTPEARKIQIDTRTSEAAAEAISKNLRIGVDQVPPDVRMPAGWTLVGDIYIPPIVEAAPEVVRPEVAKPVAPKARKMKEPATMTAGEVNKELDRLRAESSQITQEFIAAGRGNERPSEYLKKTDPLSVRAKESADRMQAVRDEVRLRYGTDVSTLPTGRRFGPRARPEPETPPPTTKEGEKKAEEILNKQVKQPSKVVSPVVPTKTTTPPVTTPLQAQLLPSDQADKADAVLAVSKKNNYYTLWFVRQFVDGKPVKNSFQYLTILSTDPDEAVRKADAYGADIVGGKSLSVAFAGKNLQNLQGAKTIAILPEFVEWDQLSSPLRGAAAGPIGQQTVGFGKYSGVKVDDLYAKDSNYVDWLMSTNPSSKRVRDIVDYLRTSSPELQLMADARELEGARIRAYEERESRRKGGEQVPVTTLVRREGQIVEEAVEQVAPKPKAPKLKDRKAKDQMVDIVAPRTNLPDRVASNLKPQMYPIQVDGANAVIESMDRFNVALNGDGAGVGKTRQIIAVAEHYAKQGKPVVIVTENAAIGKPWEGRKTPILGGSMAKDSEAMGVTLNLLTETDKPADNGSISITTYNRVTTQNIPTGAIVIFDESQNLANTFGAMPDERAGTELGQWQIKFRDIFGRAERTAFYSATPADKPHQLAYLYKVLGFNSPEEYLSNAVQNGTVIKTRRFGSIEQKYYDVPSGKNRKATLYKWVNGIMTEAGNIGRFIKREISYEGTDVQFHDVKGTDLEKNPWAKPFLDALAQMASFQAQGYLLLAPNSYVLYGAELTKIGDAVRIAKRELDAGRKIVIYFSRINDLKIRGRMSTMGMDGRMELGEPVDLGIIPSPVVLLRDELKKEGIKFTELHGKSGTTSQKAQKEFAGPTNVLLASVESGGTGINLDDTTGNEPRTEIFMFSPYRGISTIQAMGRIWRASTIQDDNKPNRFVFATASDIDADASRSAVLAKKLQLMNASLGGTAVSRLPMSKTSYDPSQLVGIELPEEGVESAAMAERTGVLMPVNIKWSPTRKGGFYAKATADLLEWVERGGADRTGINVSVFKSRDSGDWVALADKEYKPEDFVEKPEPPTATTPTFRESRRATEPTAAPTVGMTTDAVRARLEALGFGVEGMIRIVEDPQAAFEGRTIIQDGKAVRIELNASALNDDAAIDRVLNHEFAEAANADGALNRLVERLTPKEKKEINDAITRLGYEENVRTTEEAARAIEALAAGWKGRGFFERAVARVEAWGSKLGLKLTRRAAEYIAARNLSDINAGFKAAYNRFINVRGEAREGRAFVTPEENARFLELAKDPEANRKELQKMVDEAAKKAGYNRKAYHGTDSKTFNIFNVGEEGGMFFTTEKEDTEWYGRRAFSTHLSIKNPYKATWSQISEELGGDPSISPWSIGVDELKRRGFDGIILTPDRKSKKYDEEYEEPEYSYDQIIVFEPSQIKLTDPVTRDDQGNVIPLDQRFQPATADMRYSRTEIRESRREPAPTFTEESPEAKTLSNLKASMEKVDSASEAKGGKPATQKVSEIAANWMESGGDERALQDAITENTNLSPVNAAKVAKVIAKQYDIQQSIASAFLETQTGLSVEALPEGVTLPKEVDPDRPKPVMSRLFEVFMGVRVPPVKIQVNEKAALKDQIRLKAAANRAAKAEQKRTAEEVVEVIKAMELLGPVRPKQVQALAKRAARVIWTSEKSVEAFSEYAAKVVENANYDADLREAKDAQKRAKQLSTQKKVAMSPQREVLEDVSKVPVNKLDDPRMFAEAVNYYLRGFKAVLSPDYVVIPDAEMESYLSGAQSETQRNQRDLDREANERLARKYGIEPDQVNEMMESIDIIKQIEAQENREALENLLTEKAVETQQGLRGYDADNLRADQRSIVSFMLKVDPKALDPEERQRFIRITNNIIYNNQTNGAEYFVAVAKGQQSAREAAQDSTMVAKNRAWINLLPRFVSERMQRGWALELQSIADTFRNAFGKGAMAQVYDLMGMLDLNLGFTKANNTIDEIQKKIGDFHRGLEKKYKAAARNQDGLLAEGIVGFLIQSVSKKDETESINQRRDLIRQDIANRRRSTAEPDRVAMADRIEAILNLIDGESVEAVLNNMKREFPANHESLIWYKDILLPQYKDFLKNFDENFNDQANNYENPNYLTIGFTSAGPSLAITPEEQGMFYDQVSLRPKQSAYTIKRVDYTEIPKDRTTKRPKEIEFNLRRNVFNGLSDQINKAYTSSAWQRIASFMKTPEAEVVFGGAANKDFFIERLNRLRLSRMRRGSMGSGGAIEKAVDSLSVISRKLGTGIALGGIYQWIKQPPDQLVTAWGSGGRGDLLARNIAPSTQKLARELLNKFSIGRRGDASAGYKYINQMEGHQNKLERYFSESKWDQAKEQAGKIADVWMVALKSSDFLAASAAWMTYYEGELNKKDIKIDDWSKEASLIESDPARRQAAAFAEQMTDIYQGSSDPTSMATFAQSGKTGWENFVKAIFVPFNSFAIQQRMRLYSDAVDAINGNKSGVGGLAGTIGGLILFHATKRYVIPAISGVGIGILYGLMGVDMDEPDEEKQKEEANKNWRQFLADMTGNILVGGTPQIVESQFIDAMNRASYLVSLQLENESILNDEGEIMSYDQYSKERSPFYRYKSYDNAMSLGMFDIGMGQAEQVALQTKMLASPEEMEMYTPEEQRLLYFSALSEWLLLMRLNDTDFARLVSKARRDMIKAAKDREKDIKAIRSGR